MSNSQQLPKKLAQTERLVLRPMLHSDSSRVQHYRAKPKVAKYQGWTPQSVAEVEAHAKAMQERQNIVQNFCYQIVIELLDSGFIIGDLAFTLDADTGKTAELGIALDTDFQSKGYALEALQALIGYLFSQLRLHRIHVCIDPNNHASIKLCERAGFRHEGHLKQSSWFKGEWVDDLLLGILSTEWSGKN
jgi:RimJ/RimL family protein N-acetyltransferase